jgi:hypothetical protein
MKKTEEAFITAAARLIDCSRRISQRLTEHAVLALYACQNTEA